MSKEHDAFLQKICEEVDRLTKEHLPTDLSPDDLRVHIRLVTGKNPLGERLRVMGSSLFVKLDVIKFDAPSSTPGQKSYHKIDKYLGMDIIWVHVEHITAIYPGKEIEIDGQLTRTCYVTIMEDSLYRIPGTCEDLFDSVQEPLMEYTASASAETQENNPIEENKEKRNGVLLLPKMQSLS